MYLRWWFCFNQAKASTASRADQSLSRVIARIKNNNAMVLITELQRHKGKLNRHPRAGEDPWVWQVTHGSPIEAFGDDAMVCLIHYIHGYSNLKQSKTPTLCLCAFVSLWCYKAVGNTGIFHVIHLGIYAAIAANNPSSPSDSCSNTHKGVPCSHKSFNFTASLAVTTTGTPNAKKRCTSVAVKA